MGSVLSRPLTIVIGFLYPAFASFKALELGSPPWNEAKQWLTYWVVMGFFQLFEYLADRFLPWFPMYHWWKLAFIAWLVSPKTMGARVIYLGYIQPYLSRHHEVIEQQVTNFLRRFCVTVLQLIEYLRHRAHELPQQASLMIRFYTQEMLDFLQEKARSSNPDLR